MACFIKKPIFIVLLLLYPSHVLFSQSLKNPGYVELGINTGKVIKNFPSFPDRDLSFLTSFRIGSKLKGEKLWHKYYNYPQSGFLFLFGTLGNNKVLGNVTSLMYDFTMEQKLSDKLYLQEGLSFGLAYFNKSYNEFTNPENIVTGSPVTFGANASVYLQYYFNPFWSGIGQVSIFHSSDSHYQLPNLGVNLPTIGLGIRYHPNPLVVINKNEAPFELDRKLHFNVRVALGINENGGSTGPVNGPKYPIYLFSAFVTKKIGAVNKLQTGLEAYYNTGYYDNITSENFFEDHQQIRSCCLLYTLGHEFLMGHFSLMTNGGIYIYNPYYREKIKRDNETDVRTKLKSWFTARIGVQYYLLDAMFYQRHQVFAGIYIKTNLGQADFLESSIGYTF